MGSDDFDVTMKVALLGFVLGIICFAIIGVRDDWSMRSVFMGGVACALLFAVVTVVICVKDKRDSGE